MEKHNALESLVQITNSNLGYVPSTPAEFNNLSSQIFMKTKAHISVSSLKRMWGYVKYENFPSRTTLNILARFNDFKDWESFQKEITFEAVSDKDSSSGFVDGSLLNANALNVGDEIVAKWDNGKECTLQYISYLRFKVIEAKNIKLQKDDICTINSICIGLPLVVSNIQRGGIIIPAYIGAKFGGVRQCTLRNAPAIFYP